jgi:hypothetical protein
MKIYSLKIMYSSKTGEVYEIEEEIEEEGMQYQIGDTEVSEMVKDKDLFFDIQMNTTEVALT